ncbi:prenyltransferase [Pistricoccus aurantiacus]|uniref:prenyltransferase n=1 Tax=Pistricoccus aurantiacus TaxID=1883414 RepID=UPI0036314115
MSYLTAIMRSSRPSFLVLAPLCVLLGILVARDQQVTMEATHILLVMIGGLLAHAAVNWLNEYEDFRSGLDLTTSPTPFSGGSGALPSTPNAANGVLFASVLSLTVVVAIGGYFLWLRGSGLFWLGLLGLVLVVAYTRWLTRSPWLCLLAPGLGFGPVMILGTLLALGGRIDSTALSVALVAWLLISELLLLNQFPDVEADRRNGRRHLPILLGKYRAAVLVVALLLGAYVVIGVALIAGWLPVPLSLALLVLPLALWLGAKILATCKTLPKLLPWMGVNVVTLLVTLGLLNLGLALG